MSFKPQARYAALTGYGALSDSLGLDWPPLMRSAGLDPAGLAVQDRWIPAAAVARLLEISAVASGREDFGLSLAEYRRLANLGPLALVIREEPDVRSVLQMLIRYEHTYNQALNIRLAEAEGLATIRIDLQFGEPVGTRQATDLAVGALHHLHRQLHGAKWQPLSVCFPHPAPADISTHLRVFGDVMQFQREFAGIVLRARDLAAPNEVADPLLRPYAHQFLDTLGPPADVTMVARVRELIQALLPTGHCSIVQVARSLGVDRRTVQRRLAGSGETFSSLRNAVRAELAEGLVPNPRRSLTEVAEELGFSDPSAFSRWFRGHFGCSPKAWRSRPQQGAQAPSKHLDRMPRLRAQGHLGRSRLGLGRALGRAGLLLRRVEGAPIASCLRLRTRQRRRTQNRRICAGVHAKPSPTQSVQSGGYFSDAAEDPTGERVVGAHPQCVAMAVAGWERVSRLTGDRGDLTAQSAGGGQLSVPGRPARSRRWRWWW